MGSRGPDVLAVSGAMIALTTISVSLRFWARFVVPRGHLWWDDWLSLAALVRYSRPCCGCLLCRFADTIASQPFVWAHCALNIYWVHLGLGQHFAQIHTFITDLIRVMYPVNLVYNAALTLIKLSVLMFYVRVFKIIKIYRIALWFAGFIVVAWGITLFFTTLLACIPIEKNWNLSVPGHCIERPYTLLLPNILTDFILLILPMPMLWSIQLSFPRKIGLCGLFAAGYL